MDIDGFDWGWMGKPTNLTHLDNNGVLQDLSEFHKKSIIQEIFKDKIYEKFFQVEEGDIVLDIGASHGPFTYSILSQKPKHVFCFEPSYKEFKILVKNTLNHPVTTIFKGISDKNGIVESNMLFGGETEMEAITFKTFIDLYGIEKIDFIKTDCEGGEYDIFTQENLEYLKNNVKKIVGEWHLKTPQLKEKFKYFRDNILPTFKNYQVYSLDGIDIKWDLWNEHFIEYYTEVIIYIDNR